MEEKNSLLLLIIINFPIPLYLLQALLPHEEAYELQHQLKQLEQVECACQRHAMLVLSHDHHLPVPV